MSIRNRNNVGIDRNARVSRKVSPTNVPMGTRSPRYSPLNIHLNSKPTSCEKYKYKPNQSKNNDRQMLNQKGNDHPVSFRDKNSQTSL